MEKHFEKAKEILVSLKAHGYDAYFVGGVVRDYLLGISSTDIDITTNATPEEVASIFKHVKQTGVKYGTVTVLLDDTKAEVTTFRSDGLYVDKRRPEEVTFSEDVKQDVTRRDFTMNAILMDENEQLYDYVSGQAAIAEKRIETIGDPITRFQEDALRMLRAFRFVSKLGFDIDPVTQEAITSLKENIQTIAIERIMVELDYIFGGTYRQKALKYMIDTGVDKVLFGLEKGIRYLATIEETLHPIEAYIICFILDEFHDIWRFSNKNYRLMMNVITLHEVTKNDAFNKYIVFSNHADVCYLTNRINVLLGYENQAQLITKINNELPVKDVCDLAFKGQDILELTTLRKRSWIGLVIDDLLYNVIMGIMPNEYEVLKTFALKRIQELQKEMGETNE